jgi:hypothetical protein
MTQSPETNILIDPEITPKTNQKHQEFLDQYIWRSCCGMRLDKRVVLFFSQFSIAIMIISFSLYQLNKSDDCNHNQLYLGLLTLIIGIFLPNPKVK